MSTVAPATAATSTIPSATAAPIQVTPTGTSTTTTPAGASATDWTTGFSDEAKGYVLNKGFKGPSDILESYRNFEKLQGVPQDRILKLPENLDSPEARAIWERLGAPKEAKDYNLSIPKENGDATLAEDMAKNFHEIGVPKTMAEKITAKWNERQAALTTQRAEEQKTKVFQADQNLRKEWGAAFEQNKNVVDSAARNLGLNVDQTNALAASLGPDGAMKLLYKLGSATGEHTFVSGQNAGNGAMVPAQALSKIAELRSDRGFIDRLSSGDSTAMKQWQSAHEMAYPGENSI